MSEMKMTQLTDQEMNQVAGGASGSPTPLPAKSGCIVYKVRSHDTLSGIAGAYRTTVRRIMDENIGIISNPNSIRSGYYIYVPV